MSYLNLSLSFPSLYFFFFCVCDQRSSKTTFQHDIIIADQRKFQQHHYHHYNLNHLTQLKPNDVQIKIIDLFLGITIIIITIIIISSK